MSEWTELRFGPLDRTVRVRWRALDDWGYPQQLEVEIKQPTGWMPIRTANFLDGIRLGMMVRAKLEQTELAL